MTKQKIWILLCSLCLSLSLLSSCGRPAEAVEGAVGTYEGEEGSGWIDALGYLVELHQPPTRVAALLGSYAETWLLAGGDLVAVTQDALQERGLSLSDDVMNVGQNQSPNVELLLAAEPDFVLLTPDIEGQVALKDVLDEAGIPSAYFKVESFADYLDMLKHCTDLLDRPDQYQRYGLDVQEEIQEILAQVPSGGPSPHMLLLRAYATGVRARSSDNVTGRIALDLGAVNIADQNQSVLEDLQMESILAADPDIILVTTMGADTQAALNSLKKLFEDDPAWGTLRAVQEGRVKVLPKELFHYKPNARWGESYAMLADILYDDVETE